MLMDQPRWTVERCNISSWEQFKTTFLEAFLPSDFQTKVEQHLRSKMQAAGESLRDFVYNYRALCVRWKHGGKRNGKEDSGSP
ncbi:UNVERIFIED_CONTAM: hypothetical protein FKN15_054279 [Acipenser sinensis]